MTGARTVIDILKTAGLIAEQDGKITPIEVALLAKEVSPAYQEKITTPDIGGSGAVATHILGMGNLSITININVNTDASSLDQLGAKILKVIQDIGNSEQKKQTDPV
jgi:hypothetical protein